MASDEVNQAVGERESAAEQLAAKRVELVEAQQALAAAELAQRFQEVVQREDQIVVLRRVIEKLTAAAAVEGAAEARVEATELAQQLRVTYVEKLAALAPDIEQARLAIKAVTDSVRRCAKTWSAAARARFEIELVQMRFGFAGAPLDTLPLSPVAALSAAFGDELERVAKLCIRENLPTVTTIASMSPEELVASGMGAAARYVESYATDVKLSGEVVALFYKAGTPDLRASRAQPTPSDPDPVLVGGQAVRLPAGAFASALGPSSINEPDSPAQIAQRDRVRRNNSRRQAGIGRALREEAARLNQEPLSSGSVKKNPLGGMREE